MEFTLVFLKLFIYGLSLVAPLLIALAIFIALLGQVVGFRELWTKFDALYWSFITATTVGYGDIRPLAKLSKVLSILIALTGMMFTGIIVALAIYAATESFKKIGNVSEVKTTIENLK